MMKGIIKLGLAQLQMEEAVIPQEMTVCNLLIDPMVC